MPDMYHFDQGPLVERPDDGEEDPLDDAPVNLSERSGERTTRPGEAVNPDARVARWADVAMWKAPKHDDPQKPKVTVSVCTPDPLGVMAMVNAQYTGRNLTSPSQVTDDERREAWEAATMSQLSETPLEWIQLSINFENVSRAFTHQLVRTRMATYAQESQRFAVKEDAGDSVKLPPSIAHTLSTTEFVAKCFDEGVDPDINTDPAQGWRLEWDAIVNATSKSYSTLVESGMPAEDARGILPTNVLTRIHVRIDMKTLLKMAGSRLCTQAQFEWRAVFAELARAIRVYGESNKDRYHKWQYDLMAGAFRPVCYAEGHCPMKAKSDRYCSIRGQVDAFEAAGVPSKYWEDTGTNLYGVQAIHPAQWLADPTAARVAPGGTQ